MELTSINTREMNGAVIEVMYAVINMQSLCLHRIQRGAEQVLTVSRGMKYTIYRLTGNGWKDVCPFMDTHPTVESVVKAEAWMLAEPDLDPWEADTPDMVQIALNELR